MDFSKSFLFFAVLSLVSSAAHEQLSIAYYSASCPSLHEIVRSVMTQAVAAEPRMGASILRLFFHDCFVNGCDGSVLLDDTLTFRGEKGAKGNANSLRGFEVIDAIKAGVEATCKSVVSCADILALAAHDGVQLLGGPCWPVLLGRRDSQKASLSRANKDLPKPNSNLSTLVDTFAAKGLSASAMTVLSGAHTIGQARCTNFRNHIYNDSNITPLFGLFLQQACPRAGSDDFNSPLDFRTPNLFDNAYFQNLMVQTGLLHSDQELFNGGPMDQLVEFYANNAAAFADHFAAAMVQMGNIRPLTGEKGEIRLNCRRVN